MKKTLTLFAAMMALIFSSQAQITINASDVPIPGTFNLNVLPVNANPSKGSNQTWNYSSVTPTATSSNIYNIENLSQWTNIGVDVYVNGFKSLNANFGYNYWSEIDKASNGMLEKGINIAKQGYDLSSITGLITDSINFPEQDIFYNTAKTLLPFPMTNSYANNYVSERRIANFILNVPAFGLNQVPCQQVFYDYRKDSVVGWGTIKVYTPTGPSTSYDVLMNKVSSFTIDSFYVGGAPANATIQSAFQISQGQKSNVRNSYNFHRKGEFNYLLRLFYGADSTFSTIASAFSLADNIAPLAINTEKIDTYATFLFPNPAKSNAINLQIFGKDVEKAKYVICDYSGKIMQQNNFQNTNNGLLKIELNEKIVNGVYFINVFDFQDKILASEKISIQR